MTIQLHQELTIWELIGGIESLEAYARVCISLKYWLVHFIAI